MLKSAINVINYFSNTQNSNYKEKNYLLFNRKHYKIRKKEKIYENKCS